MSTSIIKDALEYYDMNEEKYESLKRKIHYVKNKENGINDLHGLRLTFYDSNKEELFTSRIEIIGQYHNLFNIWVWGWAIPSADQSVVSIIRKVLMYGISLTVQQSRTTGLINNETISLKAELVTSRLRITNDVQLDIHCAVASYLAKKPFIIMLNSSVLSEIQIQDMVDITAPEYRKKTSFIYCFIIDPPEL
jgi:hypothetical protein